MHEERRHCEIGARARIYTTVFEFFVPGEEFGENVVEPRRKFIEDHAREVTNLDV